MSPREVADLSQKELKAYLAAKPEDAFELVDVRQPSEYEQGHIPGARLIPLGELPGKLGDLAADKDQIYYCRSGARSAMAAQMAAEESAGQGRIFNLRGGFLGYDGKGLTGWPAFSLFECGLDVCDNLLKAFELIKAAYLVYQGLSQAPRGSISCSLMGDVARMKYAQGKELYAKLREHGRQVGDFSTFFQQTKGLVLQNGGGGMALLEWAKSEPRPCSELADLGLNLEYTAYELYRGMARLSKDENEAAVFLKLADEQKKAISLLAASIA